MANGYLGKISAVVSANTADFQSKLNASAKDVQAFARSVQSNLTSASKDAARSFESIYTPLQKFERSLQAAASMKLSFKGFAGAIKDVDVLRQRLGSMKDSQISLVLKASGMKNITDVREALVGLRAKDLQIVAKVGGIEKVRELRALSAEKRVDFAVNLIDSGLSRKLADAKTKVQELKATVASVRDGGAAPAGGVAGLAREYREATAEVKRLQDVGRQTIKTTLGVNVQKDADVDRILQAGERAEAIRLPVVLDVLGEAAVKEAVTQSQRLRSVAEQINKPFGEAVQKISAMSVEIQASFLPAMKRSQSQVESLKSSIENGVLPASAIAQQFDVVEKRVSAAVAAVNRLAEASQKINSMKTGRELAFTNPALAESLDRGVAMGNRAAGLPASAIQANPRIAAILGEYQERANQAAAAYGRLQSKIASGLPTGSAERQLEGLQGRMASLAAEFDRIYASAATDRNADRIGEMSPMDRNAGNIGARDSIRSMGERTSILDMGRSSPMDRNAGSIGARTSLAGQGARTDISDMGRMSSLEDRRRDLARQAVGEDIEAPRRQLAALANSITSVKGQIDTLPDGVRTRFVPAIREAEAEFMRLSSAPAALPGEIEAARRSLIHLTQDAQRASQAMSFSQSFGGAGLTGVNLGLDQRALQGYNAQLQVLQGYMVRIPAEANGRAVAAFNNLRNAIAGAFDNGTINTAETRQQITELTRTATAATARLSGVGAGQIARDLQRAGDVGRQGFDRYSLALNQAAFAIDDFMSSTGGIEFKLRAVSNNITQLAFVLGGTTGLFVGLGAVIAGQAAVGLIKWANNGRSAEDQTKALNEALTRQKGLVEELAQAFNSLGDAISQGTRSAGADQGTSFGKQVSSIRSKQRELRENRIADLDPDIQRGRADRNKLTKQLESETDPGRRVTIQKSIQELDAADKRARAMAGNKPVELGGAEFETRGLSGILERTRRYLGSSVAARPMGTGPISTPNDLRRVLFDEAMRNIPNRNGPGGRELTQQERQARARTMANRAGDDMASQRDAIERMIAGLRPATQDTFLGVQTAPAAAASETIARLQSLLEQLEAPFQRAIDQLALKVATASEDAARSIRDAQEDVAQAIGRGVPGAAEFQRQLDALASELSDADAKLARAVEMSTEVDDPAKREAIVKEAEKQVADVRVKQAETEARAREVRLGRSVGGERTTSAISAMEGNERFRNERAGAIASARAAADAEMQSRRVNDRQSAAVADRRQQLQDARAEMRKVRDAGGDTTAAEATVKKAEADLKAAEAAGRVTGNNLELAQAASEAAAALLEAAAGVEAALTRIRKVGDSALQRSEQGADAAQRAFEENPMRGGGREARDAAEYRLINDRANVEEAQLELSARRSQIQSDPRMVDINNELETITQRRKDLEAKSATQVGLNFDEREELGFAASRELELIRQRETAARELTADEQKQLDVINSRIAAREKELEVSRRRSEESQEFNRVLSQADGTLGVANRRADEAQQRFVNNPTDENKQRRDEAEDKLRKRQSSLQRFQDMADATRKQIEASPEFQQNNKELQQIAERRAQIAGRSAGRAMTADEIRELTGKGGLLDRENELRSKNEGLMQQALEPYRDALDEAQRRDALLERADRGRDLGMTDRERFRKEFTEGAGADINARAKEMRDNGEDPAAFLRQAFRNQMEAVAPMLQGFQEERQNAILQGPSRAALNVSDVSTSQGASELTRLIRGDDSAKDVNLAELRKQSAKLQEVVDQLKANNPGVLL